MPGVQKPHCRPCSSLNPSWTGCSSLGRASPSTVVTSWPSAWTASIVQLLTGVPSNSTVQAPQLVVSQPVWVPVSLQPLAEQVGQQQPRLDVGGAPLAVDA